ncbi:hypothetical protein [Rheinheimera sp.]|uniref:hypothetical protein n=1 Tax=Rheinheimera sp. TaxID=1869214 RepID=UPI00307D519D
MSGIPLNTMQVGTMQVSNHWLEYQLVAPQDSASGPSRRKLTADDYKTAAASAQAEHAARQGQPQAAPASAKQQDVAQQEQEHQQSQQRQQLLDSLFAQLRTAPPQQSHGNTTVA